MLASSAMPWELLNGWDKSNSKYFGHSSTLKFEQNSNSFDASRRAARHASTDFKVKLCPKYLELGLSQPQGNSPGIAK